MRIRSIKPEFWRSEDICALGWHDRLLFIGLWSYVDDNGVGRDDERIITADLFALDGALSESSVRVRDGLKHLESAGLIVRYSVHGKRYLHITTWAKHQKINRPSPGRFPLPTHESAVVNTPLSETSVSAHEDSLPGAGEQGSRGTGEQGAADSATRAELALAAPPAATSAQAVIAEWIDYCGSRPPGRTVGQVAKEVGTMLAEGIPVADVRRGLEEWQRKGLHPSALSSVVHEVRTAHTRATRRMPGDIDWDAAAARAAAADAARSAS